MEDDKPEHEHTDSFNDGSDICQQLMDRYSKSSAPQHRHLLATAAAMRSLLVAESLPLTPPAYFAAAIAAVDGAASSPQPLDATAVAALLSFLAIVLPLAPPRGIHAARASEAVKVLVRLLEREKEGLAVATVRAGVKCLGVLVGFCDLEDWDSVKLGFETLMKFSVDRRPKVRRCSQECLEKLFKSVNSSTVIKEASKLVMSMLKPYMPLAVELITLGVSAGSKDDMLSEPKNVEVLHMLNMLKLIVPFLSMKTRSKVLSEVNKIMKCQFSALTRHILQTIEKCLETSTADAIAQVTENILVSLSSYVSLGDKNPSDTIISATTLLKHSLDILLAGESSSYVENLPLVFNTIAGLLTSEASIASHAAINLKELISHHVDQRVLSSDDNQPFEVEGNENVGASVIKSACAILEKSLMTSDGKPNEYILAVISALFLKLGGISHYYMKNILLKLADLMIRASKAKSKNSHLENCIGSAVVAMGPEKILTDVPITLNAGDFTCANIWLVPILRNYVVGASLGYYMEHVMPLAKSFQRASRRVKSTTMGQNLQDHAYGLWGLLPSFCRYPTDLYQNIGPLTEVLLKFLKDSSMHENVAVALQVLVNQNKGALNHKTDAGESNSFVLKGPILEFINLPTYSKKIATKNIKALASCSSALLQALAGLFIDSTPGKRSFLKDAIGCVASITDSSITKKILMSFFEHFKFIGDGSEFGNLENEKALIDKEEGNANTLEKDSERCAIMELASSLVGGAKEDLVELIYNFIKYSFKVTDGIGDQQAYHTLSRILQEHAWFCSSRFVELIDLLLGVKSPTDITTLRSRFACFHPLMVHLLKIDSEAENSKAFLIVNEIILTLKDVKEEEARKAAYDVLLDISSSLRDVSSFSSESSDAPYQKLINMVMGYLSGASPHIKSGAVSVLSVLIYKDASICLSMPDLIPSLLPLLQGKSLEVIKAVLGFLKVLASCLEARDLQNLLSSVVKGILPWSAVSRNHFRSKVTVILEIMIRKCSFSVVESVTPERYRSFVKSVLENRHNKNSKDTADSNAETRHDETSTSSHGNKKRKELDTAPERSGLVKNKWRREKKHIANGTGRKESNEVRRNVVARKFSKERLAKGKPENSGNSKKHIFNKGPRGGQKRKMNTSKKDGAVRKPAGASTFGKRRKLAKT